MQQVQQFLFDERPTPSEPSLVTRPAAPAGWESPEQPAPAAGPSSTSSPIPNSAEVLPFPAGANHPPAIYVATNLESWVPPPDLSLAADVASHDRIFRRLDAMYHSWLARKIEQAREARDAGRVASEAFAALLFRWSRVHAWAADRIDEEELRRTGSQLDEGLIYVPPGVSPSSPVDPDRACAEQGGCSKPSGRPQASSHDFGSGPFLHPVTPDAVSQVEAIRTEGLALGFNEEGLFRNRGRHRFPYGEDYGLVCFIGPEDRIGKVTREGIEILGGDARSGRLMFYNRAVERPWVRRIEGVRAAA